MNLWPEDRAARINHKLRSLLAEKDEISYTFVIGKDDSLIKYFSESLCHDFEMLSPSPFRYVELGSEHQPDVLILTVHGQDLSQEIWNIYLEYGEDVVIVLWHWDNHHGFTNNLKSALAGDLIFPSHWRCASYLWSPSAVVVCAIPACVGQWSRDEASALFESYGQLARKNKILMNYVLYETFTERNEIIRKLEGSASRHKIDFSLMPRTDISRYFKKTAGGRFQEWAAYKATIVLPLHDDVSTRFFDALLSGMVPIVAPFACEIDQIVSLETQRELGVVRLASFDLSDIDAAIDEALLDFDAGGFDAARRRHCYALENHLVMNRVTAILENIFNCAVGNQNVEFMDGPHGRCLYQVRM